MKKRRYISPKICVIPVEVENLLGIGCSGGEGCVTNYEHTTIEPGEQKDEKGNTITYAEDQN